MPVLPWVHSVETVNVELVDTATIKSSALG